MDHRTVVFVGSGWIFWGLSSQPLHQFHEEIESQRSEWSCLRSLQAAPSGSWAFSYPGCMSRSPFSYQQNRATSWHPSPWPETNRTGSRSWFLVNSAQAVLPSPSHWLNYPGRMGMCANEEGFSQGTRFSDPTPLFLSLQGPSDSITLLSSLTLKDTQRRNKGLHFLSLHILKTLPYH